MESFQQTQACKNSKAASSPFYRVTEGESWMPLVQHLFAWRKSSENPCNPLCLQRSLEVYSKYNWIDRCSYGMHVRWVFHAEPGHWLSPCGGCLHLWKPGNKTIRVTFNELCPKKRERDIKWLINSKARVSFLTSELLENKPIRNIICSSART